MPDNNPAIIGTDRQLLLSNRSIPFVVIQAGDNAARRFVEFFTATIRNRNTREAYARAVWRFFEWCEHREIALSAIEPILVACYIEELCTEASAPTVKLHLAAIRMLFDWLVTGHIVAMNPAAAVKGPKHVIRMGKTPVLLPDEAALLLDSIPTDRISGLRDRALIGLMVFSFARISEGRQAGASGLCERMRAVKAGMRVGQGVARQAPCTRKLGGGNNIQRKHTIDRVSGGGHPPDTVRIYDPGHAIHVCNQRPHFIPISTEIRAPHLRHTDTKLVREESWLVHLQSQRSSQIASVLFLPFRETLHAVHPVVCSMVSRTTQ
ncbi:site-specific tyrosine recombinase XerD [Rubinisphaera italica]|uniref:Site-specific tyrosine recombinase XerD n=1 Tax=Rubinisphaera italica TaxID=2527969 RepID=A0A5C5XIK2_9PLAN|nr:site-specific tyrosine recombinase XerD [Rubinisphaera italica]